jgi:Family of unknown function (DUF6318)
MTRRVGWRRYAAAISVVACVTLVGCGGNDGDLPDSGLPSDHRSAPTDTTSPTSRSSPSPPAEPDNIDNTSPAAAKAFARYVVDLINYMNRTADWQPFLRISNPSCQACENLIKNAKARAKAGTRVEGGAASIVGLRYLRPRPADRPTLDITLRFAASQVFQDDKTRSEKVKATQTDLLWSLEYREAGGWEITRMEGVQ